MELEFIKWLAAQSGAAPPISVGIGDDAALVSPPPGRELVVTTDMLTDRVHFDLREHAAERIGRKALAVNLSDLAAMGAEPLAAFVSINVPRNESTSPLPRQLYVGMRRLADQFACPIAGGDTNVADGPLVISVTALGSVEPNRAWLRSAAQPGDHLLVTGSLGGSRLGRHLDFTPRVDEAKQLLANFQIHAAVDISDGLALDLSRIVEASGFGAIVDLDCIPISPDAITLSQESGKSAIAHALGDGEDFELLFTASESVADELCRLQPLECGITEIGQVTADPQMQQRDASGQLSPLEPSGYQHGA